VSLEANSPLPICLPRSKGFDMGIVAVLDKKETVAEYAVHPAHMEYVSGGSCADVLIANDLCRVHRMREELCDDTLAYDLEF